MNKIIYSPPHKLYKIQHDYYIEPDYIESKPIVETPEANEIRRNVSNMPKASPTGYKIYGNLSATAYLKKDERQTHLLKVGLGHYQILNKHNDDEHMVCVSEYPVKKIVVVFRGTSLNSSYTTTRDDLANDALIGLSVDSLLSKRFKRSLHLSKKLLNQFSGYNLIFTGHSLGSAIAKNISDVLQCESHSFALPSSLYQLTLASKVSTDIIEYFEKNNYNNKFIYSVRFDPIGEMGMNASIRGIKTYVPAKSFNLHSVLNFC